MDYSGTMEYFRELLAQTTRDATLMICGVMALLTAVAILELIWLWRRNKQ